MKRNAIVRICIYSLLILVLLGLLAGFLFMPRGFAWTHRNGASTELAADTVQTLSPDEVSSISIEWALGDIIVNASDNAKFVAFHEEKSPSAKPLVYDVRGGQLNIQFWEGKNSGFGNLNNASSKDLFITVPKDFDLRELELDMASGKVKLEGLTMGELDFDGADVDMTLDACTVRSMDVDAASGEIKFDGALDELNMDSASASFEGTFRNHPRSIDMDGMSNDLDITLPEDCGFTVTIDGMSNRFTSDYSTTSRNGAHVYGDGSCRIDVDGMSGSVIIRKG